MRESRKSKFASMLAILAIALIAFFLIFALNSLAWPVGSAVGNAISQLPTPVKVPDGVLLLTVVSNQTIVPSDSIGFIAGTLNNPYSGALAGVLVKVYLSAVSTPTITNFTDNGGHIQESLAPNTYAVKFFDWRLNNLSVSVQISSNSVTSLTVAVNASSYAVQSFDIADPDSAGFAVNWEQIYALVGTNQSVPSSGQTIYLDTLDSPQTPISEISQQSLTQVSLTTASSTNHSQWLQIQVKNPINIAAIRTMTILTLNSNYSVKSYAIQ